MTDPSLSMAGTALAIAVIILIGALSAAALSGRAPSRPGSPTREI